MKKKGKVVRWDPARGFGFIRSGQTNQEIFFHIKDFRGYRAPFENEEVSFDEIHVGGKGPRAMGVNFAERSNHRHTDNGRDLKTTIRHVGRPPGHRKIRADGRSGNSTVVILLILVWIAMLAGGTWAKRLPIWTPGLAIALNFTVFYIYWLDKFAAQKRQWRTRENTLHLLALAGGWPGAWFAQQILRHKSRKISFRQNYWATVIAHCAALATWLMWLQPKLTAT